jgi:uncharacterized protein (TIGR03083 family)
LSWRRRPPTWGRPWFEPLADVLGLIESEGGRLAALVSQDPEHQVPQYPGWTLEQLLVHTGAILGRTAIVCRDRVQERISSPRPDAGANTVDWFESQLRSMLEILANSDPGVPVWGFGPSPNIGFWWRRMLVEVGVHRWDAEQAFGRPIPLLDEVAEAGLDEFVDVWLSRLDGLPTIEVNATDLGRDWVYGPGDPVHTVEGNSSDLYLRLMARPSPISLPDVWAQAVDALEPPPR